MSRDEAMMFPNDRIRTWLANKDANPKKSSERSVPTPEPPIGEERTLELEASDCQEPELGR